MAESYKVTSTTWVEDGAAYVSYNETVTIEATNVSWDYATELAGELIDKWLAAEKYPAKRVDDGWRYVAYVEMWPKAWGIRVDIDRTS